MQLLNERYDFRIEPYQKQDGSQGKKLYLVGDSNENTYAIKDIIKKNGFRFDGYNKQWYIFLSNDNNKNNYIIDNFVKPLIDQITKIEDGGNGNRNPDDVTNDLKSRVIDQIDQVLSAPLTPSAPSSQEIQDRLQNFKEELVKITSSAEFKKRLEPIIKFRQAQGINFRSSTQFLYGFKTRKPLWSRLRVFGLNTIIRLSFRVLPQYCFGAL